MNLAEKYRPKTLDDVIGQDEIVMSLKDKKQLNHMIFVGQPGTGKTTIAKILADVHGLPLMETNASDDRGIGMVRDVVKKHSQSTVQKVILLDESESLTPEAQDALRAIIEKSNSIFILTGNNGHKFSPAIKSRCTVYEFKHISDIDVMKNLLTICKKESIDIEKSEETKEALKLIVRNSFGDMRKAINTLEKVVSGDKITRSSVLSLLKPNHVSEALNKAIDGDLESAIKLLENDFKDRNFEVDVIIQDLYDTIGTMSDKTSKAKLYYKLWEVSRSCQIASRPIVPLIHLVGFLSYAWLIPHFPKECPLKGEIDG